MNFLNLREWIEIDKIDWKYLSINPNAIHLLEQNPEKINWDKLSSNINAVDLLEKNIDKINWGYLSRNPNAISILEQNIDKINWIYLSLNPNAIHLLELNIDKINWNMLSLNPNAIYLLEQNSDKINWEYLAENPNAIDLIKKHIENQHNPRIYIGLSYNPNAYELLYEYSYKLKKGIICYMEWEWWIGLNENTNPDIFNIFKQTSFYINWYKLSSNPNIFTYNYKLIYKTKQLFNKKVIRKYYKNIFIIVLLNKK